MKVNKEEKELRENRRIELNRLIKKHNIKTSKLSLISGIKECNLSSMKTGKIPITEVTWKLISESIEKISFETNLKPNVEVEDWDYVVKQLNLHRNVWINKSKVKDIDQYIKDLNLNGFNCTYSTDKDGGYIIANNTEQKPMVEKVIQPAKPKVEEDLSIISKVRNMHQDSLVMHEEALKLQASTEDIVKSVDDMEARIKGSVTGAFGVETVEKITITDEDIKEAQESKDAIYQPTQEEKEELKELAEETLANCGLEKGIHSVDLVEFLETRLTKLEVRGFLRGKAIESLLEEDYQTAAMCIKYFMDNGYTEVGEV